jgi:hypothetical protein
VDGTKFKDVKKDISYEKGKSQPYNSSPTGLGCVLKGKIFFLYVLMIDNYHDI